jgi:hypothetical protein
MKRTAALAPLSRDHHLALVVARQLSRATPAQAGAAAQRFVRFLAEHELAHFALEETVLLPALPDEPQARALAEQTRKDHRYLRAAMQRLRGSPQAADVDLLHEIGGRLRTHVQMEERELFPYLERSLEPAALDRIGAKLARETDHDAAEPVRRFLAAFIDRDIDALVDLADPAIELHPLRLTHTPAYQGHEGLRQWLAELALRAAHLAFEGQDVRGIDREHALAHVRVLSSGEELAEVTAIFTVIAGKISEVHGYFL